MGVRLTSSDIRRAKSASHVLLSPFDYASTDAWRIAANQELRALVEGDTAIFLLLAPPLKAQPAVSAEFSAAELDEYLKIGLDDAGAQRAREMKLVAWNQTGLVAGDWDGYHRDPAVNDWYMPHGLLDGVGIFCPELPGGSAAVLEINRDRYGSERFGDKGLALMTLLIPSFLGGIEMQLRLASHWASLSATIDRSDEALLVFDLNGLNIHSNIAANRVFQGEPQRDRLTIAINTLVKAMALRYLPASKRQPSFSLDATATVSGAQKTYHLRAAYLGLGILRGDTSIVVTVTPAEIGHLTDQEVRQKFDLTNREVQVAHLLARLMSAREIASALGVSLSTARRHTERVLAKLGVHSRREVAAVLRGGLAQ
jgi:DNA-binding CsgD family transcriptional regulator